MEKKYKHQDWEEKIYRRWKKVSIFKADPKSKKPPFCIIMPPPNANAPLHIGHAMFLTIEDIMARFARMRGKEVLLLPGADHAGILTQVVFEKKLEKEGKSRHALKRNKFYRQCLKFTLDNKKEMFKQTEKMGVSCDWSREKFTLDKKISKQVFKTFVRLYKDKLVYRGERMINWCPRCATTLSDLEVEHFEEKSKIYFIKYPLVSKSNITGFTRFLVVATTRPETMLGDSAIAVHPKDGRYKEFIGKTVLLPIANRKIPVIADKEIDPEFGTGVVKVTPAHDPIDWRIGQRHQLESINVIGFDNKMTSLAGKEFAGMPVGKAREKVVKLLQKKDTILKEKTHFHSIGRCERCKTIVEPKISKQWFIKVRPLANEAIKAVKKRKIRIIPEKKFKKNFLKWMKGLHDWCVSRQIWWGHRIPVWYCGTKGLSDLQMNMLTPEAKSQKPEARKGCGHIIVALSKPKKCPKCGKTRFVQDPDTFDTWFSSAQWPYTTLGYPNGKDYKTFYPTSVMETGYEILPIWVARMMMLGIYRTGKVPFKKVFLHGLVRDAFGQKMSKSLGNVVNPLDAIEKYGADALRLALITGSAAGNDISIGEDKIKGYRNFSNKLWNIGRFIDIQLKHIPNPPFYSSKIKGITSEDTKIIKSLNLLIKKTTNNLNNYYFSEASQDIYQFIWHELADVYIENIKERLQKNDKAALSVLRHVFLKCLKLLHPFAPFVTEVLWSQIPRKKKELLVESSWPK